MNGVSRKRFLVPVMMMCVLVVPGALFGDVGIGAAAFSDTPILAASDVNRELLDGSFSFGANGRLKFDSVTLDALALYASAAESIDLYMTGQLSIDLISLVRLSAGIGPAFRFPLAAEGSLLDNLSVDWLNAKIDADLILFRAFSVGLSFQYLVPSSDVQAIDFGLARGRIGVSFLIW